MKIKNTQSVRAAKMAMVAVAALIVGIPFSVSADSNPLDRASAELRTLNNSGISGEVTFRANGSELSIEGEAEGMDPGVFYVSLLYDILSVATGAFACEPGFDFSNPFLGATEDAPGRLSLDEMGIVDFGATPLLVWDVSPNGKGHLNGTVDVDLDRLRTMSLRDTSIPGPFGPGTGPLAVSACGLIVSHGVDDDDDSDSDSDSD